MRCANCGEENAAGRKFCSQCGSQLAVVCPGCGSPNEPRARFCGECGLALADQAPAAATAARAAAPQPAPAAAERRLVSVLFVDLVGFTAASEQRDPEVVRELLTRYFELGRRLVELYGGSLEKFIGDALMAVWGTPVANEDDAERAVRTALDLLEAVQVLGEEAGVPGLRARAGVMTGEAAVTLGAVGQGMVAGDLVNSASRVQSLAEPGSVLVGDATKRTSEAAVAYEDAGEHAVKGREEPIHLWRAMRVVAARGGSQRSTGLEPPFVGRDRELRLLKELFHASAEEGKAHLVSVTGIAGIGKSRLGWELFKYIDGVAMLVRYAAGRCLAYGDGVTYWALAEMVRRRADIVEADSPEVMAAKLDELVTDTFADEDERRWAGPRLAVLLGLDDTLTPDRQDLFAAWRRFFERLSESAPAILLFEDMQWADPALLEFIDYLLDWSRGHPLFVVSLGRPSAAERGLTGGRNLTQLHLEPLSEPAMRQLVSEVVPGLPDDLLSRIVQRSDGVPLYAVETIRMLIDRRLLVAEGDAYRPAGPIPELEVPESLHGLIAARLDGLEPDERRLIQDAAVLGKTFTADGVGYLAGRPGGEVQQLLTSLVRKDVLAVQADPRSPERGQYGFVQDLVREVAYETLSRHDRRERHLRVAAFLEQGSQPEAEIAEVLAAHYEEAFKAAPEAAGAAGIRDKARAMFARAGERAAALAATGQARLYFERALDLTDDPAVQAELHDRAGQMAIAGSAAEAAQGHYEQALAGYEGLGRDTEAALVLSRIAQVRFLMGRFNDAIERLEQSKAVLDRRGPSRALATVTAQLARLMTLAGRVDEGAPHLEKALTQAERLDLPDVVAEGFATKAVALLAAERVIEAETLLRRALEIAESLGLGLTAARCLNNLAVLFSSQDRLGEEREVVERGLALARRLGDRAAEATYLAGGITSAFLRGDWDGALEMKRLTEEVIEGAGGGVQFGAAEVIFATNVLVNRGEIEAAERLLDSHADIEGTDNPELRLGYLLMRTVLLGAQHRHPEALSAADRVVAEGQRQRGVLGWLKACVADALQAAVAAGDLARADEFLAILDGLAPNQFTPFARATRDRYRALIAIARGESEGVEADLAGAAALFLETGMPFHQAATRLEHAEWLLTQGRAHDARQLLVEAREIFERLRATPWLARVEEAAAAAEVSVPATS